MLRGITAGEHHHTDVRRFPPQLTGDLDILIRQTGRQVDVGDHHFRFEFPDRQP